MIKQTRVIYSHGQQEKEEVLDKVKQINMLSKTDYGKRVRGHRAGESRCQGYSRRKRRMGGEKSKEQGKEKEEKFRYNRRGKKNGMGGRGSLEKQSVESCGVNDDRRRDSLFVNLEQKPEYSEGHSKFRISSYERNKDMVSSL